MAGTPGMRTASGAAFQERLRPGRRRLAAIVPLLLLLGLAMWRADDSPARSVRFLSTIGAEPSAPAATFAPGPTDGVATTSPVPSTTPLPTAVVPVVDVNSRGVAADVPQPWLLSSSDGMIVGGRDLLSGTILSNAGERALLVHADVALMQAFGPASTTLRIRDLGTGSVRAEIVTDTRWVTASASGSNVILAGWKGSGPTSDSGLQVVDLETFEVSSVVDPQSLPAGLSGDAYRVVTAAPDGSIVTSLCASEGGCIISRLEPADVREGSLVPVGHSLRPPAYATGSTMIMYGDGTVSAVSLDTGKTLWTLGDAEYQEGFITSRGDLVQSYIDHANEFRYTVALIDVRTGRVSVIWTAPVDQNRVLWPQFSSDGVVVIGSTSVDEALDEGQASASALDLSTGELTVGALTITIAGG